MSFADSDRIFADCGLMYPDYFYSIKLKMPGAPSPMTQKSRPKEFNQRQTKRFNLSADLQIGLKSI